MNPSELTRKEQVLHYLRKHAGEWVDGWQVSNERVGGSEGLRRLRELIVEGQPISARRNPDPTRDAWQYRYQPQSAVMPTRRPIDPPQQPKTAISEAVTRNEDGTYTYVPTQAPVIKNDFDVPAKEGVVSELKFITLPKRIDFGMVAVCPRCRGRTQRYTFKGLDEKRHQDPYISEARKREVCIGCNGWGYVPNHGPIPLSASEE